MSSAKRDALAYATGGSFVLVVQSVVHQFNAKCPVILDGQSSVALFAVFFTAAFFQRQYLAQHKVNFVSRREVVPLTDSSVRRLVVHIANTGSTEARLLEDAKYTVHLRSKEGNTTEEQVANQGAVEIIKGALHLKTEFDEGTGDVFSLRNLTNGGTIRAGGKELRVLDIPLKQAFLISRLHIHITYEDSFERVGTFVFEILPAPPMEEALHPET